jgi:DNA-binding CsgD family transcriptional regulator
MPRGGDVLTQGSTGLVGREAERGRVDAFVAAVAEGPRTLVLKGEAGIGKTTLWRHAVERCREAGIEVLLTRSFQEEMPLALVGLVDLFEHVDEAVVAPSTDDPLQRGRAVLAALRRLTIQAPTVIAIDDLHWLDSASARALRYAVRRLETERVGVLATMREASDAPDPLGVAATRSPGQHETLELGPLSHGALRRVLDAVVASISRPALRRIHAVSGGNPLYAIELARGLGGDGRSFRLWDGLPLPDSLQAAIAERLKRAPDMLDPLLEAVAAAGPTSVVELRAMLPTEDVGALLAAAEREALLVVEDDLAVRFAHPLLGSAVYSRMRPLARGSLHGVLAERTGDPDARARHLALSTHVPDSAIAELLEDAAGRASSRGALDLAAEFASHSLRLTPDDDGDAARRRALAEIGHLAAAGEVGRALELVDRMIEVLPAGPKRVDALVRRAELQGDDFERVEVLLVQALEEAGEDELARGRVLDELGFLRGSFRGDFHTGIQNAREALEIAERLGDRALELSAAIAVADMEHIAGTPRRDLNERAVAIEAEIGCPPFTWGSARVHHAKLLRQLGDLRGARAIFESLYAEVLRSGDERSRPNALYDLACLECYSGNLAAAEELAREATEAARDTEDTHVGVWALYPRALVAAWRGDAAETRATTDAILDWASRRGSRPTEARARSLLGLLALSEGATETAVRELEEATRLVEEMGLLNSVTIPARPDAIEALAGAGDVDSAEALLGRLEAHSEGVENPLLHGLVGRSRGIVLAARGEAEAGAAHLERAAADLGRLGFRPDAARATLALGRALLRAGHRGRAADALADARTRFAAMGAMLWEARAAEELDRAAPGRATGELTRAERRVAALVAEGRRNREIAAALLMSTATVEAHLTRIYRKLEIRSRTELARLVADGHVPVVGAAPVDDTPGDLRLKM